VAFIQGVDFAVTQVVDGNFGVHGVIPKGIFEKIDGPVSSISRNLMAEADLKLSASNVHWGYFSKTLAPALTIESGSTVIVEMATHHACDDYDKMILGDTGLEEIYTWNSAGQVEDYRGATGKGDGVHILTGPIYVNGAEPGDILKVEILDLEPRANSEGKTFGVSYTFIITIFVHLLLFTDNNTKRATPLHGGDFSIGCHLLMGLISRQENSQVHQVKMTSSSLFTSW
jgi:Acetamidase/Formamidase family